MLVVLSWVKVVHVPHIGCKKRTMLFRICFSEYILHKSVENRRLEWAPTLVIITALWLAARGILSFGGLGPVLMEQRVTKRMCYTRECDE
jgi:hypothetical protein